MSSLTLEKKVKMINKKFIKITNERYDSQYIQNIPRSLKKF